MKNEMSTEIIWVFHQVIDNPGTSVQPSWLAEDVKSSSSERGKIIQWRPANFEGEPIPSFKAWPCKAVPCNCSDSITYQIVLLANNMLASSGLHSWSATGNRSDAASEMLHLWVLQQHSCMASETWWLHLHGSWQTKVLEIHFCSQWRMVGLCHGPSMSRTDFTRARSSNKQWQSLQAHSLGKRLVSPEFCSDNTPALVCHITMFSRYGNRGQTQNSYPCNTSYTRPQH